MLFCVENLKYLRDVGSSHEFPFVFVFVDERGFLGFFNVVISVILLILTFCNSVILWFLYNIGCFRSI